MTPEAAVRWDRAQQLFAAAMEKAPSSRGAFLAEACGDDRDLRSEVETLLAAHDQAGGFLESAPAGGAGAENRRLVAGTRIGPYEIIALVGAGGMGEVYRARDTRLGRDVAIKVLPAGAHNETGLRRFEQEARAAGSLNHPNILAVYDIGSHEGAPYIVAELLQGQTLRKRLAGKPLPLRKAIDLAVQLAQGLAAAHHKGVIHRDLKPENLFITDEGRLKILDFGIAKLVRDEEAPKGKPVTQTGAIMGTIGYMSPEQVRGERADHRSDLFAFGAILSEMLTGKLAFDRPTPVETGNAILNDEPRELPEGVPIELDRIVRRCLEKNPQERFQSAHDLAFQLATVPATATGARSASRLFIVELRRRRVFRALIGYGIAAFAVLQIVEPIMHGLHWPDAVLSYIVAALAAGFPIVVSLAWIFDLNAGRIERTAPAAVGGWRGARLAALLVGIGVLAAAPGLAYYLISRRAPARAESDRSVAVLPFANLSSEKENEFFVDGVQGEIITQLGKITGLKIIARGSVQNYREGARDLKAIAQALGVSTLLEGSVQRAGGRVRITAQLVDAATSRQLWSERYDRDLADTFAIQTDVALEIARSLGTKLTANEKQLVARLPTEDREAYDLYLRGVYYLERSSADADNIKAMKLLEQAVARDPSFALAHAQLAIALAAVNVANCPKAREQADRALALQFDLPESHFALATLHWYCQLDAAAAVREALIASRGAPNDVRLKSGLAFFQAQAGDELQALENGRKAYELDPRSFNGVADFATGLLNLGHYDEAEQVVARLREINPEDQSSSTLEAWIASQRDGNFEPARKLAHLATTDPATYIHLLRDLPESALAIASSSRLTDATDRALLRGQAYWVLGQRTESRAAFEDLMRQVELVRDEWTKTGREWKLHYLLAAGLAGLGRANEAFEEVRRAENLSRLNRDRQLRTSASIAVLAGKNDKAFAALDELLQRGRAVTPAYLRASPYYASLRSDPRFAALLAKYGDTKGR